VIVMAILLARAGAVTAEPQAVSSHTRDRAIDQEGTPPRDEPRGFWRWLLDTTPAGISTENGDSTSFWSRTGDGIRKSWSAGQGDIMVPGYIWHTPWHYSEEQRTRYNTVSWGIGYGHTMLDAENRARTLLGLVSADSFNRPQYMAAYIWRARWRPGGGALRLGAGYSALVIGRSEFHYAPLPLALPLASIGIDRLEFVGAYVPGFEVGYFLARVGLP
jgi:palmitoyl transferase